MPFSWKDFASKWFRCKLVVCWDGEPRTLDFALGLTCECRQGVSAWFSSDSSFFFFNLQSTCTRKGVLQAGFWPGLSGCKASRESWWRLLKTCLMFDRIQRGSLKPAVTSVEKSAGPNQWLRHSRKASPECLYSEVKFLWHPHREQNPRSPEHWASSQGRWWRGLWYICSSTELS